MSNENTRHDEHAKHAAFLKQAAMRPTSCPRCCEHGHASWLRALGVI